MTTTHKNNGTCSRSVTFSIDNDRTVTDISFVGGCNGNLKGIAAICEGMKAEEIIRRCDGIRCGFKSTSCPDQLAQALKEALTNE